MSSEQVAPPGPVPRHAGRYRARDIGIRVDRLGKRYRLGAHRKGYTTFREMLVRAGTAPLRALRGGLGRPAAQAAGDEVWALRDVSFEVRRGEVVGIIGRNGAGKSTLLKILSRITEPTVGGAEVHGRMGSLLEVGTGFHPELSGRENIYLNGAILGMRRVEVEAKFADIVEFAEVSRYLDTPVKHYSSGMYLRLAFAVAAHLEPEILVVDEVLAVGDAAFQRKCLQKMGDVAHHGRTVLFVSHNMAAVSNLCDRVIWLEQGQVRGAGPTDEVIASYLASTRASASVSLRERTDRGGNGHVRCTALTIRDAAGRAIDALAVGEEVIFSVAYETLDGRPLRRPVIAIRITDPHGASLFTLSTHLVNAEVELLPPVGEVHCRVPMMPLVADRYAAHVRCWIGGELADEIDDAAQFAVMDADVYGSGRAPVKRDHGTFVVPHAWQTNGWRLGAVPAEPSVRIHGG